jgi:hypothetical protein
MGNRHRETPITASQRAYLDAFDDFLRAIMPEDRDAATHAKGQALSAILGETRTAKCRERWAVEPKGVAEPLAVVEIAGR